MINRLLTKNLFKRFSSSTAFSKKLMDQQGYNPKEIISTESLIHVIDSKNAFS